MHVHRCTSGTPVLAQNIPTDIFQARSLRVLVELNASEITRITCACITTRDFNSSPNQAVQYHFIANSLNVAGFLDGYF